MLSRPWPRLAHHRPHLVAARTRRSRPRRPPLAAARAGMRVFLVSDLHTDYKENLDWLKGLSLSAYQQDCLILGGDVSDDVPKLSESLQLCAKRFKAVWFTPGNHDLWVRKEEKHVTSIDRLHKLCRLCDKLGVHWKPAHVDGVWVVPILSWYHSSWDTEPDLPGSSDITKIMTDFSACRWPNGMQDEAIARHIDELNEEGFAVLAEQRASCPGPVISFSHFLPLQALLPEKRMLFQPNLAKAAGSTFLPPRIQQCGSVLHCFGHTHFNWDAQIEGVRYVQWPQGYPQETRRLRAGTERGYEPFLLYDTATGITPPVNCYWSNYYKVHEREPSNLQPAPWVGRGR